MSYPESAEERDTLRDELLDLIDGICVGYNVLIVIEALSTALNTGLRDLAEPGRSVMTTSAIRAILYDDDEDNEESEHLADITAEGSA